MHTTHTTNKQYMLLSFQGNVTAHVCRICNTYYVFIIHAKTCSSWKENHQWQENSLKIVDSVPCLSLCRLCPTWTGRQGGRPPCSTPTIISVGPKWSVWSSVSLYSNSYCFAVVSSAAQGALILVMTQSIPKSMAGKFLRFSPAQDQT